jgi:surface protein
MLQDAYAFNAEMDRKNMFDGASSFNTINGSWNTSSVTNMNGKLHKAYAFNKDIGSWDTSSVMDMKNMF